MHDLDGDLTRGKRRASAAVRFGGEVASSRSRGTCLELYLVDRVDFTRLASKWATPDWSSLLDHYQGVNNVPDDELAEFYRWRVEIWFLAPAERHFRRRKDTSEQFPGGEPNHMTALMVLACCVGALAEVYEGTKGNQVDQIDTFLSLFGRSEWKDVVGGDTLARRFVSSFRHALVHALRIRRGDEFRSGSFSTFYEPRGRNVTYHTSELVDDLLQACRGFLDKIVEPGPTRGPWLQHIRRDLEDKSHLYPD